MSPATVDDARLWAFALMEASGLTVGQMWAALAPYLSRRDARRRRPTWSAEPQQVILLFQGGMACRALTV